MNKCGATLAVRPRHLAIGIAGAVLACVASPGTTALACLLLARAARAVRDRA